MESSQQRDHPNLAKMAADAERLFSSAGYMINDRRNCLHIDTIEVLECLKLWYRQE
jgi:hypothetical protein